MMQSAVRSRNGYPEQVINGCPEWPGMRFESGTKDYIALLGEWEGTVELVASFH